MPGRENELDRLIGGHPQTVDSEPITFASGKLRVNDIRNASGSQSAHIADAAAATAAALTDSTGGSASQTLAALTNVDTLTDSTSGSADNTVSDVSTAVTGVDGSGSNAASKADVDTRLTAINNNFKELVDQIITQEAHNTAVANALASLADEVNKLITDVGLIRTAVNAQLAACEALGIQASS